MRHRVRVRLRCPGERTPAAADACRPARQQTGRRAGRRLTKTAIKVVGRVLDLF